ncbi:hypothetical protein ACA910_004323 [Epithemia clementina (nom. ined.)]
MIKELLDSQEPIDLEDINRKGVNSDLEKLEAAKHTLDLQPMLDVSVEIQEIESWKETFDKEELEKAEDEEEVEKAKIASFSTGHGFLGVLDALGVCVN